MKSQIELYLGDERVEFSTEPQILMTYTTEDTLNPTAVKNNFSKTLTIEGTPNNNRIFGHYYDVTKVISTGFNPAKRVPFTLWNNGEKVETGYLKLDRVRRNNGRITYDTTLYGGLGDFLYNLSTDADGNKLTLADLDYGIDMSMVVNKTTVGDAWEHIAGNYKDEIYDYINFAPCYNGIPDNFAADKVAINTYELPTQWGIETAKTVDDVNYGSVGGWILGELNKPMDEWQMRDLRSHLQRPVINFRKVLEACFDENNNGGYEVELDERFFNNKNPYYNNVWMTLPMMGEVVSQEDAVAVMDSDGNYTLSGLNKGEDFTFSLPFNLNAECSYDKAELYTGARLWDHDADEYFIQTNAAYYVQAVVYDKNDRAVGGSPIYIFYSSVHEDIDYDFVYTTDYDGALKYTTGTFKKFSTGYYIFNKQNYKIEIPNMIYEDGMYIKINSDVSIVDKGTLKGYGGRLWNNPKGYWYPDPVEMEKIAHVATVGFGYDSAELKKNKLTYELDKDVLLMTEHTPCDYLLSYCKMFNLHIVKDKVEDVIRIMTRGTFYNGEMVDISSDIDVEDDVETIPLTFNAKWYKFAAPMDDESQLAELYKTNYGTEFGSQRVDTNYNFDSSVNDLFEDSVFQGGVMQRKIDRSFVTNYYGGYDGVPAPAFLFNGFQPILYDSEYETTEATHINAKFSGTGVRWYDRGLYLDFMPKVQFNNKDNEPVDGKDVLLFFNGTKVQADTDATFLGYMLTDDIPQFEQLNDGEPCWIYTTETTDKGGAVVSRIVLDIPQFSRYITENDWITYSWDFGTPQEIYVDGYNIDTSSDIYHRYWANYVRDRYNVNTRTVTCKVNLKGRIDGDTLRRFYWFDNSYWVLNRIIDYNPMSSDKTKCEFVQVNDMGNYNDIS